VYDFFCSNNPLAAIPPLPRNLNSFSCDSTLITQLPALPPFLQNFYCRYNPQVVCLPYMTNSHLLNFRIDMSGITCVPNRFTATNYDWNPATMPICSPNSPCAPSYSHIITGNVHAYTANSCAADSLAPGHPMSNIKVLLKQNGQIVQQNYSNDLGQFAFATDSLQGYIVEIDTVMLPFQVTCPASASYSTYRPLTDTVADGLNFGLLCPGPDYGIRPIPGARFKPGDTTVVSVLAGNPLKLWYGADCGAGTAGAVMTSLSGPIHYAGPATGALTPVSVSGDTLLYNISDLDSLMPGDLYILVYTDTTALIGTPVCIAGHVTPAMPDAYPADDSYTECSAVVSAFDPNYKEAYPAMLSADPEWLTYTVHFQNTGNDTADRVVVKDTLSVDLDISSFQYLGASHKASVQLSGNVCTFTFAGIELPASTINNEASQGWLQYKIRTNAGLAQTALVRNTAYIYFDYNPAVATNTTTNSFITGIHQPSLNGNVHLYPNPNNGSFILETKGGKSSEYAVYDVVGRLMLKGHQESMTETIHMPDAADGIYTIVIRTGDSRETIRFVLSR
ncbi:MAG: hypothetical protein JWO03_1805, partial [Bacteroidetes bacterium]|nr:hypothetical protein [Bacteroidota bacterium]